MNSQKLIAALALVFVASSPAFADVTREQVKTELTDAVRTGDMYSGDFGKKLNEISPAQYPARNVQSSVSREQVKAELANAIRTGDVSIGDFGQKLYELAPGVYPARHAQSSVTRDQVKAETFAAIRPGILASRSLSPSL